MPSYLLCGLGPKHLNTPAKSDKNPLFIPKTLIAKSGERFPLPPLFHHRLNLPYPSNYFPSSPISDTPSLLPSLVGDSSLSSSTTPVPAFSLGKRSADEEEEDERPAKKTKYGFRSYLDSEGDADDEDSDFDSVDTRSDSEMITPAPAPAPAAVTAPESSRLDFNLTANLKKVGYIYNPGKSVIDLINRFASSSESEHTDDNESNTPSSKKRGLTPSVSFPTAGPLNFNLTAKKAGYIYNPRKSMIDLTSRFAASTDSDDTDHSESDFSDTPSSKRRAFTPPTPVPASVAASSKLNFNLTAKQAGYVYNPRKSMIDLTNRFASPSNSDLTENTNDSESDFNFTPNNTPSPITPAHTSVSSRLPLPLPLPQWRYHHIPIDPNNPKTPPSAGTKRKMEQVYAEWRQAEMDAPRAPSFFSITMAADTPEVREIEKFEQVDHAPAQYNQQSQQQTFESSRAPSYSPLINASSLPQAHHPNPSITESSTFPPNLPSPSVPIRLEPHSPILDHLTAAYIAQGPHPQLSHVHHAMVNQVHASEILNKHVSDRMPFVRVASRRLQAVVGVRNDLPFDLLMGSGGNDARNLVVGKNGALVDLGLAGLGRSEGFVGGDLSVGVIGEYLDAVRGNGVAVVGAAGNNQEDMGRDMDFNTDANTDANEERNPNTKAYYLQNIHTPLNVPPSSSSNHSSASQNQQTAPRQNAASLVHEFHQDLKMPHFFPSSVNPHTGEGLREYLLTRALLTGSKKRECRSISFHDFTPDVRTGEFRNRLLVHFGVDGISKCDRVEVVELSLPDKNGILHPWLSIFIQRPLLTIISPLNNFSTSTPPNFPSPTPTTWLCLAVPLANITTYPIQSDTTLPSSLLEETLLKNKYGLPTKKIARRQDYDFSFQGIPIFEFSTRELFSPTSPSTFPSSSNSNSHSTSHEPSTTNQPPISDFLSISGLPPYDPQDPYLPFPPHISQNPELLQHFARKYAHAAGVPAEELRTFGEMMEDESGVDVSEELSPNEGIWWSAFYRGITRDRIAWERVRRSMGRGRCRVVVRWQDVPVGMKGRVSGDGGVGLGLGLGLGLERRESEMERVMQEMGRESMGRNSKRKARKSMNGGLNQNVGLGVTNSNVGVHTHPTRSGSGEALRDTLRARAIGNRMSVNGGVYSGIDTQNLAEKMHGQVADFMG
ncbi:hypothetical protein OCU04_005167 [Sclerotinia nivalis]|uniref:Uncharacterized protein n=1 Tax=Sclerotinia nivalis TaxID=352851 RepID=A0A9X0DKX1_9HELO|nr:hypothetical protein OCU04_005167 [Sclerotinia nivalis]